MRRVYLIFVLTVVVRQGVASPPEALFSPPPASGVPSLHLTSSPLATAHPETRPNDAALASPRPQGAQNSRDGWDALRRETLPEPVGSPTSQAWRWLVGLAVALALIKWGLPRALNGGNKGQIVQWFTRLAPPKSEGTITVLDTRFLGAGAVHLITVRGRTLLIGSTAQQVNLLMDLTEQPDSASAFDKVLAQSRPFTPEPTLADETDETRQVLRDVQQRLQQARQRLEG
ncbi:MAG: flagellar biosynthetic protein FliO [Firmicutes bacterium]|nr:flagellar biosynthetic protein FliO [Bacillota bacterium]